MDRTPTEWMTEPLRRYAQFTGRARRAEYWWFVLGVVIVSLIASVVDHLLGLRRIGIDTLVSLGLFVPQLAVGFRRLHDLDRSGWWLGGMLVVAIPFGFVAGVSIASGSVGGMGLVGLLGLAVFAYSILLLVWLCQRGTVGDNRFGPDPIGRPLDHQL